jgi:hypothetical protein
VVVVIVIALLAIYFISRRRRTQRSEAQRARTRQEFGSEYERTAEEVHYFSYPSSASRDG